MKRMLELNVTPAVGWDTKVLLGFQSAGGREPGIGAQMRQTLTDIQGQSMKIFRAIIIMLRT